MISKALTNKDDQVVFRRIHGRVVPIHVKKVATIPAPQSPIDGKKAALGVGLALAGGAIAYAAGKHATDLLTHAARIENNAMGLLNVRPKAQLSLFGYAATGNMLRKSNKFYKRRNVAILSGALAGGALISAGTNQIKTSIKDQTKVPSNLLKVTGFATGLGLAAQAANFSYFKNIIQPGVKTSRETFKKALTLGRNRQLILKGVKIL